MIYSMVDSIKEAEARDEPMLLQRRTRDRSGARRSTALRCARDRRRDRGGRAARPIDAPRARRSSTCRLLGDAGADRSARASARPRFSAEGDYRDRLARRGRGRIHRGRRDGEYRRRSTTRPRSRATCSTRAARFMRRALIPVSAVTKGLTGRELVDFAAMAEAGRGCFPTTAFRSTTKSCCRRAAMHRAALGFAISLHEEDRDLSGEGAANAGEVSKRLGVAGIPPSAETRARAARPRARDRRRRPGPYRACLDRRIVRAGPRSARARRQCHLRGHAASFQARRARGARMGPERQDESAAAHRADVEALARGDGRRHHRHDRDRSCAA